MNDKKSQKFLRNNFEIQKQTNLLLNWQQMFLPNTILDEIYDQKDNKLET